ncbi:hypothetical protein MalM25_27870 [Planctomycetes bacterium MalM25]|nr:hypothetical protein MalM25_27870 [Planctomycetes bacterium MalM25]
MAITDQTLWSRLQDFDLDDPAASLTFTRRLARENGWDHAFARRVVEEYKRFVYLAMTAGHEVTPSDEVDQAWHLHLTYTRSYWDDLCGGVLGQPLHHGPTKGGQSEGVRFEDQYERTLASYRAAFCEEPPAEVWPPSAVRFGEAPDFVRVNRQRVWLAPKPWRSRRTAALLAAGGLALLPPLAMSDDAIFLWIVIAVIGVMVIARLLKGGGGSGGGCGAFFGGGCGGDGGGSSGCGGGGCGGGGCGGCGG